MTTTQATSVSRHYHVPLPSRHQSELATASSRHLLALDGVRGLAILLVLIYHFTLGMSGSGLASRLFLKLTATGWCGVDLFFVLSGFLITGILFDAKESPHRFRNFYARRALRIFPLYYGILIFVFVFLPLIAPRPEGRAPFDDAGIWLWGYGTNILASLRNAWFPLGHFWSLAVEEHFYMFWPAVVLWCDRRTVLRVCASMVIIALVARLWMVASGAVLAAYCLTVCRMDALAIGGFLALVAREPAAMQTMVAHASKIVLTTATALVALAVWRLGLNLFDPAIQVVGYLLLDLMFAGLILHVVASPARGFVAFLLTLRPLRWLGLYSYGIYVFNSIFLLVAEGSSLLPRLVSWSGSTTLGRLLYVALAASTTLGSAWLSWHLLEKHFLKLKAFCPLNAQVGGRRPTPRPAHCDVSIA
jgi:peptidoglycan/LPS O-acetylase OafA/YrhL